MSHFTALAVFFILPQHFAKQNISQIRERIYIASQRDISHLSQDKYIAFFAKKKRATLDTLFIIFAKIISSLLLLRASWRLR